MLGRLRNMTSIYITKGDRVLMLHREGGRVANGLWVASAGGHFEPNELNDAGACVLRELREELGLTADALTDVRLRYIALRRRDGEIRQNYYYFAELRDGVSEELTSNEGRLQWFERAALAQLKMPFTAQYVIEHYIKMGAHTDALYGGVADGEKVIFTELPDF